MLMIRFQRVGKKKSPSYRVVISEKAKDTHGDSLEILGNYNPVANPKIVDLKVDRIKHWLGQGAQASESVHNLLVREGIVTGDKKKSVAISNKRHKKIDEKKAAAEEKNKAPEPEVKAEEVAEDKPEEKESAAAPEGAKADKEEKKSE